MDTAYPFFSKCSRAITNSALVLTSVDLRTDAIDPALQAMQGQVNAAAAEFMKDTLGFAGTRHSFEGRRMTGFSATFRSPRLRWRG